MQTPNLFLGYHRDAFPQIFALCFFLNPGKNVFWGAIFYGKTKKEKDLKRNYYSLSN